METPGDPLELDAHSWLVWTHDKKDLNSQEHDMRIKWSFTPSVQLNINDPTENKLGSVYQGKKQLCILKILISNNQIHLDMLQSW